MDTWQIESSRGERRAPIMPNRRVSSIRLWAGEQHTIIEPYAGARISPYERPTNCQEGDTLSLNRDVIPATHPLRVVIITTVCTALALFGDSTLYPVLPVQYTVVGVTTMQVGLLLSVNRLVRLPLNVPAGWLVNRWGARWLYILGLLLGALSTLGYGLFKGLAPWLALRTLWGVAWTLIAVAGYTMVLNASDQTTHGRYAGGHYSLSFFGGSLGAMLGGILVDRVGLSPSMLILGSCTAAACLLALALPNIRPRPVAATPDLDARPSLRVLARTAWQGLSGLEGRLWLIVWLNFSHRFFFAGVFYSLFGLYLQRALGDSFRLGALAVGIASLSATLLFVRNAVSVLVSPSMGYLSDRLGDRRLVLLLGQVAGVLGLAVLAFTFSPLLMLVSVLLIAVGFGLVPSMLLAWMADLSDRRRGPLVGGFQTMGDLGSGLAPLIAYPLVEWVGIRWVFAISAIVLAITIPLILLVRRSPAPAPSETVASATETR
jgi:MFS family permease